MNKSNEFLNLINIPVMNTDNTIRYSLMYQVKVETLSHHITEVMWMSYIIGLKLKSLGEELDMGAVLENVLLHDADEVLTGDIPRSTKYYSKEGLNAMKEVAADAMKSLSIQLHDPKVFDKWNNAKEGKEGTLLVLADMLCVSRKCVTEIKLLGNAYFLKVAYEMRVNLDKLSDSIDYSLFNEQSTTYIRQLIKDSKDIINEIFEGDDRFDRYGIDKYVFANNSK